MYGFRPFTDGSLFFSILTNEFTILSQTRFHIANSLIQIEETRTICEKKERSTFHVSES